MNTCCSCSLTIPLAVKQMMGICHKNWPRKCTPGIITVIYSFGKFTNALCRLLQWDLYQNVGNTYNQQSAPVYELLYLLDIVYMVQAVLRIFPLEGDLVHFVWDKVLPSEFYSDASTFERTLSPGFEQDSCIQVCSFVFIFTTGACRRGRCFELGKTFLSLLQYVQIQAF